MYSIRTYEIPEAQRTAQGTPVTNIITIPKAGAVTAVLSTAGFDEGECLVMATTGGLIKKVKLSDFAKVRSNGLIAIKLRDGDSLAFVERCRPGSSVMVASDTGRLLHFDTDSLRPLSRSSMGVKASLNPPSSSCHANSLYSNAFDWPRLSPSSLSFPADVSEDPSSTLSPPPAVLSPSSPPPPPPPLPFPPLSSAAPLDLSP